MRNIATAYHSLSQRTILVFLWNGNVCCNDFRIARTQFCIAVSFNLCILVKRMDSFNWENTCEKYEMENKSLIYRILFWIIINQIYNLYWRVHPFIAAVVIWLCMYSVLKFRMKYWCYVFLQSYTLIDGTNQILMYSKAGQYNRVSLFFVSLIFFKLTWVPAEIQEKVIKLFQIL